MRDIRNLVQEFIAETGQAHFELRQGKGFGVVFHDEGEFILLSDLAFNSSLGFFKVPLFPDAEREAGYHDPPPVDFTTAVFTTHDGVEQYPMWAIIPNDGTSGFIVGEWPSVLALYQSLQRLVESNQADEQVNELDERLGHRWLSVSEAAARFDVPVDTVRYAAREGHIPMTQKEGNEWRFPQRKFLWWLHRKYTPRSQ